MRFRFFIYCAATLIAGKVLAWEQVGTEYRTYLYTYENSISTLQDSSDSDTVFAEGTFSSATFQVKVYEFILPQDWQNNFHGFDVHCSAFHIQGDSDYLSLQLYPRETDLPFYFPGHNTYWGQFGMFADTVIASESYFTSPVPDTEHNQVILEQDFPNCQRIYIIVEPLRNNIFVMDTVSIIWQSGTYVDIGEARSHVSIQLYPTLFTGAINYEGPTARYSLYNVLGQTVRNGTSAQTMDFSALPTGVYFFQVEAQQINPVITKIVKIQ